MTTETTTERTDILGLLTEIKQQSIARHGYPPKRVLCTTAMRSRIVRAICDHYGYDYTKTLRKAVEGLKLLNMLFVMDNRMPHDELHFMTKSNQLIVRCKVDQEPLTVDLNSEL